MIFKGTLNKSIVHPREIFKYAYLYSTNSIVCIHNHLSGDSKSSIENDFLTKNLLDASRILGIALTDYLIIENNNYYSYFENGELH